MCTLSQILIIKLIKCARSECYGHGSYSHPIGKWSESQKFDEIRF